MTADPASDGATADRPTGSLLVAARSIAGFLDGYDRNPCAPLHVAVQRANDTDLESDRFLEAEDLRIVVRHIQSVMQPDPDRADLIETLSWAEDMERGRWGPRHATEVLDAHDAKVHADLLTQNTELQSIVDIASASDGWSLAIAEITRLRKQINDLQYTIVQRWGNALLATPETKD